MEVFGPSLVESILPVARSFHECDGDHPQMAHRPAGMSRRVKWWTDWKGDEVHERLWITDPQLGDGGTTWSGVELRMY